MIECSSATRRSVLVLGAASAASGCALLSSPKPVPLFRFGQSAGPGASAATQPAVTVLYNGSQFPRAAAGDRILTVNGVAVSYIGGSRWSGPASNLFDEAVLRAFQGSSVRLLRRGTPGAADASLRLEVRTFEARYPAPDVAPTVVVETRALLTPLTGSAATLDVTFDAERRASENRVSAIAAAFDAAVADVLARTVAWTRANARSGSA